MKFSDPTETIHIVIPVHNRKDKTEKCLSCLSKQSYTNINVTVIDDGSSDGTSEMIENQFPNVVVLKGDGNLWWAGATNLGCKYAFTNGASLILTLNDDLVIKENYLETMYKAHLYAPKAIIGSINLTQEDHPRILFAGVSSHSFLTSKSFRIWRHYEYFEGQYEGLMPTIVLPGRGTLIPRNVFESIGFFDSKRFPHYKADYEFTNRARKAGFSLYVNMQGHVFTAIADGNKLNERGENDNIFSFFLSFFNSRSSNYLLDTWTYCTAIYPKSILWKLYLPVYFAFGILRKWGSFMKRKIQ